MSYLRSRRRVRLLVDHLSWISIRSSIWPAIIWPLTMLSVMPSPAPGTIPRGVFVPPGSGASAVPRRTSYHSPPTLFRRNLHTMRLFSRRHYAAVIVIAIAIALEVCGCDLARRSAPQTASSSAGAMPSPLISGQMLSFYDPNDAATKLSVSSLRDDFQLLARPMLNEAKPLPWAIPESVYFVYRSGQTGPGGFGRQPLATAFVLSVPDQRQREFVRLLVTARHVVDPRWARCAEDNPASIDLRLNRRSGGVGYETVSLESRGQRRFLTPSDPTADIAVMLLDQNSIPNIEEYKFIDVPFRMLPTDAEIQQFRPSQPVITARAAVRSLSESGNFPVFDGGVIAKMSNEAVNVQCGALPELPSQNKSLHLWMINAGAPESVSGAPVYAALARGGETGKTAVLLGVQSVAWPEEGVAGITPSALLSDLVQTALRENRPALDFYKGPALVPKETSASIY